MTRSQRLALDIREEILVELECRMGFDEWWDDLGDDVKSDIREDMKIIISRQLREFFREMSEFFY